MPSSTALPPPHSRPPVRKLLLLTLCVVLVHGLLLGGVPPVLKLFDMGADASPPKPVVASFVTRTLSPDPLPVAPSVKPPTPAPVRAQPRPTVSRQAPAAAPAQAADPSSDSAVATSATSTALPSSAPASAPATNSAAPAEVAAAPEPPPAPPARAPETVLQRAAPLAFPESVRLLYDGRGEERGFVKYAASSELLWLQDGAQYSAQLEISAWGFRVRTWTSKGALNAAGLAPLRFGDKPRGAELATHFQRDKGIISFSANNPDVPLQSGAQDKLSALLQLSALVAGAPERYRAGSLIRFQAADAHRAELWEFKVEAMEALELPGGPKQALKLSKAPTAEFDQSIEVWLAPDMHYLPVRLRITEANGAFADLLWRKTQNSE